MSDLRSEAALHEQVKNDDVVPLWRLPMEQKEFSSWSGNLMGQSKEPLSDQFSGFSIDEEPKTGADLQQQNADIFDVAYKKGWEDGQAAIAQDQIGDGPAANELTTAMNRLNDLYSPGSFEFILKAIESLFRRCSELAVPDGKLLQLWATKLADSIDENQKGATLILHPDDLKLIDQKQCKIPLASDENVLRGNVKLSHSGGWIEKGSEVVLDELRTLIDEFSSSNLGENRE